jgi:hypothetical protein
MLGNNTGIVSNSSEPFGACSSPTGVRGRFEVLDASTLETRYVVIADPFVDA